MVGSLPAHQRPAQPTAQPATSGSRRPSRSRWSSERNRAEQYRPPSHPPHPRGRDGQPQVSAPAAFATAHGARLAAEKTQRSPRLGLRGQCALRPFANAPGTLAAPPLCSRATSHALLLRRGASAIIVAPHVPASETARYGGRARVRVGYQRTWRLVLASRGIEDPLRPGPEHKGA